MKKVMSLLLLDDVILGHEITSRLMASFPGGPGQIFILRSVSQSQMSEKHLLS